MTDHDEQVIRFTVKELFLDLKNDIKELKTVLVLKADQAAIEAMDLRVTALETDKAGKDAVEHYKRWQLVMGGVVSLDLIIQALKTSGLIK